LITPGIIHEQATNSVFNGDDRNFNANYGRHQQEVLPARHRRLYQTLPLYSSLGTTGVYVYGRTLMWRSGARRSLRKRR
jgi:hypothetical protein